MTYCVAMRLRDGMVFASDSRTNAGFDQISTFRKMFLFQQPGERLLVLLSAGNLATSQSVISLLEERTHGNGQHLLNVSSMYEAAVLVGNTLREVVSRDTPETPTQGQHVDFGCSLILGGQIAGEQPRLFHLYPEGNFIEATEETPYFQIGESKYGKPIIDRILNYDSSLELAYKTALISFDSTMKSNLSVGMPIDTLTIPAGKLSDVSIYQVTENDRYLQQLQAHWTQGIQTLMATLPAREPAA
ncbi:MAG: peptidase [Halomonadaceae bacterium]|nr:MAG: peptidase [Halomonadaceae bacterium]